MVFVAPGAPFPHSLSPSSQAYARERRRPEGISGSPNRPDARAWDNFSLIRPGPAGRSPARDAPRSCHEAGARGAGPSAALGRWGAVMAGAWPRRARCQNGKDFGKGKAGFGVRD